MPFLLFPSKKHPPLIPFVRYEIEFSNSTGVNNIKRLEIVSPTTTWCKDPQRLAIAYFFCEVVCQSCTHQQYDTLANEALIKAEQSLTEAEILFTVPLDFLCRWMDALGYLPEAVDNAWSFDVIEGVFLTQASNQTPGAKGWNDLLSKKQVTDKRELKEAFRLMITYLNAQVPNFNVAQTTAIIQQIFY